MLLYKYLSPDRIGGLLCRGHLRLTQPIAFNDPFECHTAIKPLELLEAILTPHGQKKYSSQEDAELRAGYDADPEAFATRYADVFQKIGVLGHAGIVSFSSLPDSLPMWGYYADSHRGFVAGFDSAHSVFQESRTGRIAKSFRRVARVKYSRKRPVGKLFPDEANLARKAVYLKSKIWKHEREYRLVRHLEDGKRLSEVDSGDHPVYVLEFPSESLRQIVLGCRMSESNLNSIARKLDRPLLRHVQLSKTQLHPRKFRLDVVDIEKA